MRTPLDTASSHPRRSPLRFIVLVVVLAAPMWLLGTDTRRRILPGLGVDLPVSALMFLSPLVAALILIGREEGRPGIRRLFRSMVEAGGLKGRWMVPTLFLLPLIYGLSYLVHRALDRQVPDLHVDPVELTALLAVFLVAAASEEAGWTGYATEPLQEKRSAFEAALLLGLVWAGIHVIPDLQSGHSWGWIAGQRTYTVALRVLIVWLYNNTGRTLAAPVLFHAMDNVSVFSTFPGTEGYEPAITATLAAVAAATVTWLWGPRTLAGFPAARSERRRHTGPGRRA